MVEVALCFLDEYVYLFQSFQVPYCRRQEKTEYHIYVIRKSCVALLLVAYEVYHHIRLVVAYGDGDVALMYDT